MEDACFAINQYFDRHSIHECSPEDYDAFKDYLNTPWDYGRPGFQLYYAYRLFERRVGIAGAAFDKYLDDVKAGTTVVSIGCGPGPELAAAYGAIKKNQSENVKNVGFLGIDSERGWKRLYRAWTKRVTPRRNQFKWRTENVASEDTLVELLNAKKASVVIFSYFLRDFGNGLNPRRLMERVRTLQQVFVFDNPRIQDNIVDQPSKEKKKKIYREGDLARRTHWEHEVPYVDKVQVLAYSRYKMDAMVNQEGFAIMLRTRELAITAANFKSVERCIASSRSSGYRVLVPFVPINDFGDDYGSFCNDFVNLVAPRLADALKIREARARKVVTAWCKDVPELGDESDRDDFYFEDLIEDLLAFRDDCSPFSGSYKF